MIGRIREALRQGHETWKWRHDTDILLRLLAEAEEERRIVRALPSTFYADRSTPERVERIVDEWRRMTHALHALEQVDPWQA